MATILTSTGTQVGHISVAFAIELTLSLLARRLVCFRGLKTASNLILEIGQETTVLTTLPFLVVSCGFAALLPFWFAE